MNICLTRTPALYRIITQAVINEEHPGKKDKRVPLTTVYCKIANIRNQNLNAYQKLTGLDLRASSTTKSMIQRASKMHDSVSYSTLTKILDEYATETKKMIASWKDEVTIHCGDNLDVRTQKRYEGGGTSVHELHLYNNMLYKARTCVEDLSDIKPDPIDITTVDYSQFLLSKSEENHLLDHMNFHIRNVWKEHLSPSVVAPVPLHSNSEYSNKKTEKVCVSQAA